MNSWTNKTVLITGASSGIGESFARHLAVEKAHLILVARREERLKTLAAQLSQQHGIRVDVIARDLGKPGSATELFQETERRKLTVDVLINNAGFGTTGRFLDESFERNMEMIQLNITTLTELTYLYLPGMVKRKEGAIINVASVVAFQAVPYMGTYAATKAFVLSFSEALWEEYRGDNITIMALCPGTTATEFFEVSRMNPESKKTVLRFAQTADEVVQTALQGLREKRSYIVSGWMNYLMTQSHRLAPREAVTRIAGSVLRPRK